MLVKKVYFIRQSEIDFYKRYCNNIEKPNEIFGCCLMYLRTFYKAVLSGEKSTRYEPLWDWEIRDDGGEAAMIDLFEHNQTAYCKAVSMLAERGKAAVVHPTGTGKSFIAFKLADVF